MDNVDILWYSNTTSDSCNDGNTILSNYFYNTIRIRIHILCGMEGNMNQFLWRTWFKIKRWLDMSENTPWYPSNKEYTSQREKK